MRRALLIVALGVLLGAVLLLAALRPPRHVPPAASPLWLSGVTVIQPGAGRWDDHTVVVRDGRIAEVRPRRATDPDPLCAGCFVLPGLIDAHVHTPPRALVGMQALFGLMYLAHGVTTVRDVGSSDASVADLAARWNAGRAVGPRMLRCGPVLDGEPPGWPMAETIRGADEGGAAVRRLAEEGVDCIKVYNEVDRDAFHAVAAAAREAGLPLVGHVPHAVGLDAVTDFEAQHLTGLPYLAHPRPPLGMDVRSEDLLAMTDTEIRDALDAAAAGRVAFTPTLANFALRLIASDPSRFPPTPATRFLPPWFGPAWGLVAGHPEGEAAIETQLRALATTRDLVGRARDRGIDVLAGTDTLMPWVVPGESLWLELEALADAFGDPEAALVAATTVNGRHLAPGEIGVVAAGARADLLVLSADPTRDLAALGTWRMVVAGGRRYDRSRLEASLARHRAYLHGAVASRVMGLVVGLVVDRYGSARARDRAERGTPATRPDPGGSTS